jgi:flagellar M-ring protein FliF
MIFSDYWGALSSGQRMGLAAGVLFVVLSAAGAGAWLLLHDPYVTLASGLSADQVNELAQGLERAKVPHRIGAAADGLDVPRSQLGKARALAAGGPFAVPPSVGLELFNETDFSTTDFAQKINYQRALQGELVRTIQTIAGVRSARVHVTLAEGGLFKRDAARASAAVSVSQEPGMQLTSAQVRGIQRLVVAAVPAIKIDDVVLLDQSGTSLTRAAGASEGELSSVQLDTKREADRYLEGKLIRLLQDLAPQATASVSVDAVLDDRQVRVTTDEPLAARAPTNTARPTGVLVKERQSQRGGESGYVTVDDAADPGSTEWEHEYAVGRRTEQSSTAPGSIKRLSVAVALQGAPAQLSDTQLEELVANAVGIDPARGDSVTVLLMPEPSRNPAGEAIVELEEPSPPRADQSSASHSTATNFPSVAVMVLSIVALALLTFLLVSRYRFRRAPAATETDVDAVAAKVRQWLSEGGRHGG